MADHALNVVVGVNSSPDLEPQNVRAHGLSTHGLSTWISRWFYSSQSLDRIPKLMRLERKAISEDGSFRGCRPWRTGGIPLGFSGVCRIGDDGQNLRVPRVSLCPSLSGCES